MKTIILLLILLSTVSFAQYSDASGTKPIQYRRGIPLQEGYQSYSEKYAGKNLNEEKRRLFPLESTGVWTDLNPKVPRVDYLGIHFVNVDTGWAVGNLGALIKTTNSGTNWATEETNTSIPILKVNSFNGQTVIASGFSGLIIRSTDGGENWTQITSGVSGDLWGLQMINDSLGWACGTGNSLIKTTDGGITWQTVTITGYTGNNWWIDFLTENYGFIAGDGKVLRTIDGGNNWDIIQAGDNQALYTVDAIDSLHIAAAGYGGTGYRGKTVYSSDGGNTWITGGPTTFDPINCVKYINPDTGYFVMSEVGLWKTTDAGQNWTFIDIPPNYIGEYEIQLFGNENIGYDVGTNLRIFKATGNLDIYHKLIINDDFTDVFFTSEQKGFVIRQGTYGMLFRTTNGGESWDTVNNVPGGNCITFTDSMTGFIGTTTSKIYKTTNGGENWYATNGIITRIAKIIFINQQTGWAVGETRIYKTTDSGENWFEQVDRPGAGFTSLSFVDSLYGWASLGGWRPYKTTDGGLNWIEQTNLNFYNTVDVYFTSIDSGFIIEGLIGNNLFKTTNSGIDWQPDPIIDAGYNFNYFPNDYHWILNGVHQRWETTNNGINWQEITQDVPSFNKFQAPKEWIGYAVGGNGLILKYEDTSYVPVELISFEAKTDGGKIILNWQIASELNNKGFGIQKSSDKMNWSLIGFVPGKGTTTLRSYYSFIDNEISSGFQYYRLKQFDYDGSYKYSKEIEVEVTSPTDFSLMQNYPNPFNPETNISFTIPEETNVSIKLYDITGREVKVLVNEKKQPGFYTIKLKGGELSSGVYFYRLTTGSGYSAVKKLMFLK